MKTISAITSIALLGAGIGLALADCTVIPNEGCLTGPCGEQATSAASSGSGGGDGASTCKNPATGDYPCAIYDILHRKCHVCHATDLLAVSQAPFSLLTWEDTQILFSPGQPRFMEMDVLTSPGGSPQMPFGCAANCPPSGDLSDAERSTLDAWLSTCAVPIPEGTNQHCTQKCGDAPCVPQ